MLHFSKKFWKFLQLFCWKWLYNIFYSISVRLPIWAFLSGDTNNRYWLTFPISADDDTNFHISCSLYFILQNIFKFSSAVHIYFFSDQTSLHNYNLIEDKKITLLKLESSYIHGKKENKERKIERKYMLQIHMPALSHFRKSGKSCAKIIFSEN